MPVLPVPTPTPAPAPGSGPRPAPARLHAQRLTRSGALAGLGMVAAGVVWTAVIRGRSMGGWFPAQGWLADLALGLLAGTAFSVLAWVLIDKIPALEAIARLLVDSLDMPSFSYRHALALGLVAGIPEEILFRGAIQPDMKLLFTAILFGALHALTPAYFVYATTAGGLLGALVLWRGSLWAAVAAHTAIDTVMFVLLIHRWRSAPRQPQGVSNR